MENPKEELKKAAEGTSLRDMRVEAGLSIQELAEQADCSMTDVVFWEEGSEQFTVIQMLKLIEALEANDVHGCPYCLIHAWSVSRAQAQLKLIDMAEATGDYKRKMN